MSQHQLLYQSRLWKSIRAAHLHAHPLCEMCKARGLIEPATVCDHVTPHRGDLNTFAHGPFQSLCASCHSNDKQRLEMGAKIMPHIGIDGWPVEGVVKK